MLRGSSKTVLITGASAGIGRATALHLARKGYVVVATSRRKSRLDDIEREASDEGGRLVGVEMDINSEDEVARVMSGLANDVGPIDVLVNNAGFNTWGPVQGVSDEEWKRQFETNVFAVVRLIRATLPGMIERGSGTIINIGSVAGRIGTPFNGAYAASKFALEGLSESLRIELSPLGVRVAVVQPGIFQTELWDNQVQVPPDRPGSLPYRRLMERYDWRHKRYIGRAGDPIRVAKAVEKIIRSKRPGFRHPVGLEARLGMLGARFIPERLFHALVSRATVR